MPGWDLNARRHAWLAHVGLTNYVYLRLLSERRADQSKAMFDRRWQTVDGRWQHTPSVVSLTTRQADCTAESTNHIRFPTIACHQMTWSVTSSVMLSTVITRLASARNADVSTRPQHRKSSCMSQTENSLTAHPKDWRRTKTVQCMCVNGICDI